MSDLVFDVLSLSQSRPTVRVAAATITSVGRDVATVELRDGQRLIMAVTEWWPGRAWQVGDRALGVVVDEGARASFSVTRPELITALADGLIPEVRSGAVRIMDVARAPGIRAKIAVAATVADVDAVAVMVGRAANRVKALARHLDGERLDIITWAPDPLDYARNALAPAQVVNVTRQGDRELHAAAPRHQMAAAVGESGLNSSLAGQLCGFTITIVPA